MSNRVFDILAYIQRLILPAVATLIATLGQIWQWDWPVEQVVLTLTAIDTFMGVVLKISSNNYFANLGEPEDKDGGVG